jgi:hypothetical protein
VQKYAKFALEDVTNASEYMYYLKNCERDPCLAIHKCAIHRCENLYKEKHFHIKYKGVRDHASLLDHVS